MDPITRSLSVSRKVGGVYLINQGSWGCLQVCRWQVR